MNILLIFPKAKYAHENIKNDKEILNMIYGEAVSLTLPQVAASTPKNHDIEIIDENYEKIDFKTENIDLVGITCLTMSSLRAYEIADKYREMGITVVLGGNHPSALPEEAKQHADSVVVGEAEKTWPELLKDFENNNLKPFYYSKKGIHPEEISPPRRDLIKRKISMNGILVKRGCPNRCEFCTVTSLFNKDIRPIDTVLREIKNIKSKNIFIYDQNLTWNMKYTRKLLCELKQFNKRWLANATIGVLGKYDEFLKLAKEANIRYWYIGFESISQKSLDDINKKHNKVEMYVSTIKKIKEKGMVINGSFIFGFDGDTPDIFKNTIDAINSWDIDMAEFHILTPFPGTALYKRLKKENRILSEAWDKYTTANVVYKPKNMSVEELFEGTRRVAKSFYSLSKIIKRSLKVLKNTNDLYLFIMVFFRNLKYRERYKKQFNF